MWWSAGRLALRIYVILWLTAVGGWLGANAGGLIGSLLAAEPSAPSQGWTHTGWHAGTAVALVGAITGHLRLINGAGQWRPRPTPATDDSPAPAGVGESNRGRRSGVLKSALFLGGIGGMLGAFVGGNLLIFWLSAAASPYAPNSWRSAVEVRRERVAGSARMQNVRVSSHPVALYLCLTPALLGATAGALTGGLAASLGHVREG